MNEKKKTVHWRLRAPVKPLAAAIFPALLTALYILGENKYCSFRSFVKFAFGRSKQLPLELYFATGSTTANAHAAKTARMEPR